MYKIEDRKLFFDNILEKVKLSENIIGTYLIGSSSKGFKDIYSDCDFMMAYKDDVETKVVRDEIVSFFNNDEIGALVERKWSDRIWGVSIYLKNGLSSDISFGPLKDLKISSTEIKVGVDSCNKLREHLKNGLEIFKEKKSNYGIDAKINYEFLYSVRKFKIAIKRENYIYAYQLLNSARTNVMNIEGLNEGKKMHEFKAYNELNDCFLSNIHNTIPKFLSKEELESCMDSLLDLFYKTIKESKIGFDESLNYLLVIAD